MENGPSLASLLLVEQTRQGRRCPIGDSRSWPFFTNAFIYFGYKMSSPGYWTLKHPGNPLVLIVGDGAVGKTAQLYRLKFDTFEPEYDPTMEDWNVITTHTNGLQHELCFEDCHHQEDNYVRLRRFTKADAIVFVFSITDVQSFTSLLKLRDEIITQRDGDDFQAIILANKCDLVDSKAVSDEDMQGLSKEFNCPIVLTSAKTGENCHHWTSILASNLYSAREARDRARASKGKCVIS